MSQRCVLSPLPWDLSHANECARMQILRPAASLLDLALGSWLGICVLAPYPHPHVSGGFLRPREQEGTCLCSHLGAL